MDHDRRVLIAVANGSPPVVVELLDLAHVVAPVRGFVEELDGGYDVYFFGVALGEIADCCHSVLDVIAGLPVDSAVFAAVVEAVLRARCWMVLVKSPLRMGNAYLHANQA